MAEQFGPNLGLLYNQDDNASYYAAFRALLRGLDYYVGAKVIRMDFVTPPTEGMLDGDAYFVGPDTEENPVIAPWTPSTVQVWRDYLENWEVYTPKIGDFIYVKNTGLLLKFNGSTLVSPQGSFTNLDVAVDLTVGRDLSVARNLITSGVQKDASKTWTNLLFLDTVANEVRKQSFNGVLAADESELQIVDWFNGAGTIVNVTFYDEATGDTQMSSLVCNSLNNASINERTAPDPDVVPKMVDFSLQVGKLRTGLYFTNNTSTDLTYVFTIEILGNS